MVARVKGPTDHVVVVGAGLAGLSAALRLAGAGRKVTVLERESVPGGRNGLLNKDGYAFDTGPSVLTMPSLINDAFNCVGEDMKDWLELTPLTPLYRAFYADGSQLDVHANTGEMEAEIAKHISSQEAAGYRRYVDFVTKLYKYEMNDFIDRNIDSPLNLLTPNLARLIALGGFRRLSPKVNQFMKDPRLQKVYSFQAMYAGVSPQQALAIYAVIAYMDSVNGVFFPKGGMHAVPRALAAAAEKHGVVFKYNTTVTNVEVSNGRAKAVITEAGERYECDAVILNPDLPVAYRELLGKSPVSIKRLKYSPSCVTLLIGSSKKYDFAAHHNIHFGHSWDGVFDELIKKKQLMSDPSILVTIPTHDDPNLAPPGKHSYYVLFPTPNLDSNIDWTKQAGPYRDQMIKTIEERGYTGFGDSIETEVMTTPLDWKNQGMEMGAPFASAHTFFQTGPFRPRNMAQGIENVVFAGSGTQPGVGVPMVLISGRLAAERIVGPVK
ncbi:phytoene desaturase [Candidatus Planktophila vernalis]|uniref:Phytoene desaturase n=1 Tax=Candidatus Planktophila vernalis TaxID=1884907 RepID=A0A249KTK5_9ACTN|nr:phytoene desaturase family protein [Candidatus Planktophila vernalis]ASY20101.1 phytoene desaturase [Candidatus Planktophila vernalis]